jgi:hypothetical protein
VRLLTDPWRMVEGMDELIAHERDLLGGDPDQEMRGLRRQLRDLEERHERARDAYLGGAFSVDELNATRSRLDEDKEAALRQMDLCENRGERLQRLVSFRDTLTKRADAWTSLLEEHPDLLQYAAEGSPMPWDTDPFAQAQRRELENDTPEGRRERYLSLELRVVAHAEGELEVSGIFGREVLYTWDPSSRPRRTTTPSSPSSPTASRSGAGGSLRTSSPSTSGKSPSWRRRAS